MGRASRSRSHAAGRTATAQGNTEGTPARARASSRGYSSSADSFDLQDLRARGFPDLPSLPASLLDGKEGSTDARPERLELPKAVAEALTEYQRIFNAISAPPDVENQYPPELIRPHDPQMALSQAQTRVVQAMRKHLGTDPLSGQTLALFDRSE